MKKTISCVVIGFLLSGCAAKITLISKIDGHPYYGETGQTFTHSGKVTASVKGIDYSGEWTHNPFVTMSMNFSNTNGFVKSGNNIATFNSTTNGFSHSLPTSGHGLVSMKNMENTKFIRCVFSFNAMADVGNGVCQDSDGEDFDLMISR